MIAASAGLSGRELDGARLSQHPQTVSALRDANLNVIPDMASEISSTGRWLFPIVTDLQVILGGVACATWDEAVDLLAEFAKRISSPVKPGDSLLLSGLLHKTIGNLLCAFVSTGQNHPVLSLFVSKEPMTADTFAAELCRLTTGIQTFRSTNWHVTQFLRLLERDYRLPAVRLSHFAAQLQISAWHLAHLLSIHTGHGFRWHLNQCRVRTAMQLLMGTSLPIKDVAVRVGYSTASQLNQHFRATTGTIPSAFRRVGSRYTQLHTCL